MALFPLCTQPHATRRISVGSISAYARDRASNGLPRSGILFVGLLEIEWAILGGQSGEKAGGHGLLRAWSGAEIRHHERCRNQAGDSVVCRTGIRSRGVRGVFGDPDVRIVALDRRSKKRFAAAAVASRWAGTIAGYDGFAICRAPGSGSFWSWRCGASSAALAPP